MLAGDLSKILYYRFKCVKINVLNKIFWYGHLPCSVTVVLFVFYQSGRELSTFFFLGGRGTPGTNVGPGHTKGHIARTKINHNVYTHKNM